ncbi:MAG: BACON domain-containing protein [Bacteroidales bacterium]|nr:BACON domain-containing protein [Bacteroidales bacterium]
MKRLIYIILAAAALIPGLWGCRDKDDKEEIKTVELRYRVNDSYDLDAVSAKPFTIVVTSTDPWTITSEHPDWCIIETEAGQGSDPEAVRYGQGNKTSVRVQYYDNTELDDRTDIIEIRSDFWLGKRVTINQKGIAFLTVAEDEQNLEIEKAGGELKFHVSSNQKWTAAITEGDWISITEGASGEGEGDVVMTAQENSGEMRYATVEVYDRHDVKMATISITQDGVLLDPDSFEIRAGFDQLSADLGVVSNAKWTAIKDNENDDWYTIENPDNEGNATLHITLKENTDTKMRSAGIIIKSVGKSADDFVVERNVTLKQAYKITPVRVIFNNEEMGNWKSDKTNTPVYQPGVGVLFPGYARLNNSSKPFGTYTFHWSNITADARVRLWFCYSDSEEIKYDIKAASAATSVSVNKGSGGSPELSNTSVDISQPVDMTYKFDPSGDKYCKVTFLLNGVEFCSFDSSASIMPAVLWGSSVNMYLGCETGSAILEWYEYTAPMNWDE